MTEPTVLVMVKRLMVGERCKKCKRIVGYRESYPEERLNGRFRQLFQVRPCPSCNEVTAVDTWPVWWELPFAAC